MLHPQKFLVIGFCDASHKWHGTWQNTYFAVEHQFVADHIPSEAQMKEYAEPLGYFPSGIQGATRDKCRPVYHHVGEGLEYTSCMTCFPNREVTDNRIGEG